MDAKRLEQIAAETASKLQRIGFDTAWLGHATKELRDGKGYLTRLFQELAPQCTPFEQLDLLATQFDNYIAGLRQEIGQLKRTHGGN